MSRSTPKTLTRTEPRARSAAGGCSRASPKNPRPWSAGRGSTKAPSREGGGSTMGTEGSPAHAPSLSRPLVEHAAGKPPDHASPPPAGAVKVAAAARAVGARARRAPGPRPRRRGERLGESVWLLARAAHTVLAMATGPHPRSSRARSWARSRSARSRGRAGTNHAAARLPSPGARKGASSAARARAATPRGGQRAPWNASRTPPRSRRPRARALAAGLVVGARVRRACGKGEALRRSRRTPAPPPCAGGSGALRFARRSRGARRVPLLVHERAHGPGGGAGGRRRARGR